jgi:HSP20 family molecular chaperone IbpA
VDVDKIKAEFKDGIVEVHLPRGEEAKGRTIDLK